MRTSKWNYKKQFAKVPLSLLVLYSARLDDFPHEAIAVYGMLVTLVNDKVGYAWPSQYDLQTELGLSKNKVVESISALRRYEIITVKRTMGGNRYYLNPNQFSTEAEFNAAYPEAYEKYQARCRKVRDKREQDLKRKQGADNNARQQQKDANTTDA